MGPRQRLLERSHYKFLKHWQCSVVAHPLLLSAFLWMSQLFDSKKRPHFYNNVLVAQTFSYFPEIIHKSQMSLVSILLVEWLVSTSSELKNINLRIEMLMRLQWLLIFQWISDCWCTAFRMCFTFPLLICSLLRDGSLTAFLIGDGAADDHVQSRVRQLWCEDCHPRN